MTAKHALQSIIDTLTINHALALTDFMISINTRFVKNAILVAAIVKVLPNTNVQYATLPTIAIFQIINVSVKKNSLKIFSQSYASLAILAVISAPVPNLMSAYSAINITLEFLIQEFAFAKMAFFNHLQEIKNCANHVINHAGNAMANNIQIA